MPDRKYLCAYTERYLDKELNTSKNSTKSTYKNYVLTLKLFLRYTSDAFRKKSDKILSSELSDGYLQRKKMEACDMECTLGRYQILYSLSVLGRPLVSRDIQ